MSCGKHDCQRRCHRTIDHSKIPCDVKEEKTCERGHPYKVPCSDPSRGCKECVDEDAEIRRRAMRDLELERVRRESQKKYAQEIQELDDQIEHEKRAMKYRDAEKDEKQKIEDKKLMLQNLKDANQRLNESRAQEDKDKNGQASQDPSNLSTGNPGEAQADWELEKKRGTSNNAIDKLMALIGLESVKDEFLTVQEVVMAMVRQGVALSTQRFSCAFLGNPGTGTFVGPQSNCGKRSHQTHIASYWAVHGADCPRLASICYFQLLTLFV